MISTICFASITTIDFDSFVCVVWEGFISQFFVTFRLPVDLFVILVLSVPGVVCIANDVFLSLSSWFLLIVIPSLVSTLICLSVLSFMLSIAI
jgi:hypothetical protein